MLFKNTHCQSATSDCKTEFYQPLCMSKCWSASSRLPMFLTRPVPQTEWFQTEHKRMPLFQENDPGWISEFSVLHSYLKENQTSTLSIPPCLIFFGSSSPHKYLFSPSPFPSPSLFIFSSLSLVSLPHLPLFLSLCLSTIVTAEDWEKSPAEKGLGAQAWGPKFESPAPTKAGRSRTGLQSECLTEWEVKSGASLEACCWESLPCTRSGK